MPTAVRLPRLLGSDSNEARRVHPTSLSLELQRRSCSTAQLGLPEEEARLPFLAFLEIYTMKGSAGIYRVADASEPIAGTRSYTLRHAIDTLRDSRWKAQDYNFSGTMTEFLSALLAQQSTVFWQLGTCADTGNWYRSGINYNSLDELLDEVRADRNDYIFTYDFSTAPWTLNFVSASGETVDCELRETRNLSDGQLRRTRDGMCNILYLSVSTTTDHETAVTYETYQDAESIAQFGPIEGTAGVDTADVPDSAAWAAKFLRDHAWPIAQASADGFELVKATGEAWDALDIGKTARLAVARDGFPAVFPIETLRYEQLAGETPEKVRAELNRPRPRFSAALAQARETAQRAYGSSRTNQKALKENEHFQHMSKETKEGMEDCFGVIGVKLDPNTHQPMKDGQGNYIWAGANDASAEIWNHFHRTAWQTLIANVVKDGKGNVLSIGQVSTSADGKVFIDAINDQHTGTAKVRADRIMIDSTSGSSFSIEDDGTMTFNAENAIAAINAATLEINAGRVAIDADTTIGDVLAISQGGGLWVKRLAIFGSNGGVSINNGTVNASNLQVGSGGTLTFVGDGQGSYTALTRSDVLDFVTGFGAATEDNGQIRIPYYSVGVPSGGSSQAGIINFNIAATQFYIDGVAAAKTISTNSTVSITSSDFGSTVNRSITVGNNLDSTTQSLTIPITVDNAPSTEVTGSMIDLSGQNGQGSPMVKQDGTIYGTIYFRESPDHLWTPLRDFTISCPTS